MAAAKIGAARSDSCLQIISRPLIMPLSRLFMCHYSGFASEIAVLAQELRLRGVPPWVDRGGGFGFGDNAQTEARRVISSAQETFGLLFYATPDVFSRSFIREVELPSAITRKDVESDYLFMTVTRKMGRAELEKESRRHMNVDLNKYHGASVQDKDGEKINDLPLRPQLQNIARGVLEKRLPFLLEQDAPLVGINFCTRDYLAVAPDDVLDIDARAVVEEGGEANWKRVVEGLRDVKEAIRKIQPAPVVRVQGSKHLTGAFVIGRMFASATVKELLVRQGDDLWSSRADCGGIESPLSVSVEDDSVSSRHLFVEIGERLSIRRAVRDFAASSGVAPTAYLRFERSDSSAPALDAVTACAIVQQIKGELQALVQERRIEKIHLFGALPQGLMMLLGHSLNATVPVQLYEFDGSKYQPSVCVYDKDFKR